MALDTHEHIAKMEKQRSKRHFKQRVEKGTEANTKAVRRFVEKHFRDKKWHSSGEEIRKRTAITGPVVKEADKRGFGNYIY